MDNASLRSLVTYLRESPMARFASVYYDSSHDTENAAKRLELTWREMREDLERQGAPAPTLAAIEDAVLRGTHPVGKRGRGLIAAGDEILVDSELVQAPPRSVTRWSSLPYLIPLIEHAVPAVAHVIAKVDRVGADVTGIDRHGHVVDQHTVTGYERPVHQVEQQGQPYRPHNREHVEETVKQNLTKVADDVGTLASKIGASLVVLAGEVKGRVALLNQLPEPARSIAVDVESGSRHAGADEERLHEHIRELLDGQARSRSVTVIERFRAEAGRGAEGLAVQGLDGTCAALREANVQSLLIGPDSGQEVFAGRDPIEIATDAEQLLSLGIGSLEQRPAEEALPFAAIAVGADLVHAGQELALTDGFGALLRHT